MRCVAGGGVEGAMAPPIFSNWRILGNFNVLLENFRTSAVAKDKGFEFYRKIFELGPLLYSCHDAPSLQSLQLFRQVEWISESRRRVSVCAQ